jgi:hypothetical protein
MPAAYECPECGVPWPYTTRYSTCPRCRVQTTSCVIPRPLTPGEARLEIRTIDFERYCRQRDEKRERLGEPQPEEVGRAEAEEINGQLREIRALPELPLEPGQVR